MDHVYNTLVYYGCDIERFGVWCEFKAITLYHYYVLFDNVSLNDPKPIILMSVNIEQNRGVVVIFSMFVKEINPAELKPIYVVK